MSVAAPRREADRAQPRTGLARLSGVLPLATIYACFTFLYAWEAWLQSSPWLFFDELYYARLARSIAETGWVGDFGGAFSFETLYAFLTAPAWLLDDTHDAYEAAKYIGVLTMTAAAFPAYGLARTVAPPRPALFAAVGSICIPALVYSSLLMQETLSYPYATLSLFLIVRALTLRTPRVLAGAALAAGVAPLVRDELIVVPVIYAVAAAAVLWTDRRRSAAAWALAAAACAAALVVAHLVAREISTEWAVASESPRRVIDHAVWAAGALVVGLGILPALAGLAALVRPRGAPSSRAWRAFVSVFAASALAFGLYTGGKGAYLASGFGNLIEERNVIYLAPLLFAATAVWLAHLRVHPVAFVAALGLVVLLVVSLPYRFASYPAADAPSFAMLAGIVREAGWSERDLELFLFGAVAVAALAVAAPYALRRRAALHAAVAAAAALVLAWNLTGQLYASDDSREFATQLERNQPRPFDWVDRATNGAETLFLGQQIADAGQVWMLGFWNRSLGPLWSLDGTPGASPILQVPGAPDGRLIVPPEVEYVVASRGIEVAGTTVTEQGPWRLVRIRRPFLLVAAETGVYPDGWMGSDASYSRFAAGRGGGIAVTLSRVTRCDVESLLQAAIRVGPLGAGPDGALRLERVTAERRASVGRCAERTIRLAVPPAPYRVEVHVAPTFVPAALDPSSGDARELGAQVAFSPLSDVPGAR